MGDNKDEEPFFTDLGNSQPIQIMPAQQVGRNPLGNGGDDCSIEKRYAELASIAD